VAVARYYASFGDTGVTPTQALCMHAIEQEPGIDQMGVARVIAMDHATTAMVIAKLAEDGYVKRVVNPSDRRRRLLSLTAKGAKLVARMGTFTDSGAQMLTIFSRSEARTFTQLLTRFIEVHSVALDVTGQHSLSEVAS
jgi:DNA-binding MarR family transcriptional regulator